MEGHHPNLFDLTHAAVGFSLCGTSYNKLATLTTMAASENVADVDKAAVRVVFPRLVQELQADNIIDELYQRNLLKTEEYEGILDVSSKDDPKSINRRVLMAVIRRPPGFVPVLVEILREKYSSLANALEKGA